MDAEGTVICPSCRTVHTPEGGVVPGSLYTVNCLTCDKPFKFRSLASTRNYVSLTINGKTYTVKDNVTVSTSLNEFIRDIIGLKGTKVSCKEGGCGSCIVAASFYDAVKKKKKTISINSCIMPVLSCDNWDIMTIEGLGSRKNGYHPIQKALAGYNGSQCGFCSSGVVMNMFSFLAENEDPDAAMIEKSFDGNICRCTGYRSILDAMKSFAGSKGNSIDIEELGENILEGRSSCQNNGTCKKNCEKKKTVLIPVINTIWQKPTSLQELYELISQFQNKKKRFIVGNTSMGVYKDDGPYDIYIDLKGVSDLYEVNTNESISIGANVTLSGLITVLTEASSNPVYNYCAILINHIQKIANVPVRNVASWAGNLMTKFYHQEFPSDLFVILSAVGAKVTIGSKMGTTVVLVENLLTTDMNNKIILNLILFPWEQSVAVTNEFCTYKIMPRSQNAHAYVNAAFRMEVDENKTIKGKPDLLFGGISKGFVHASKTEEYFSNKNLADGNILKQALTICETEIIPDDDPVLASPIYRKGLAVALLYKFILNTLNEKIPPYLQSGGLNLVRPLSKGYQDFDTDKTQWPITQPIPKVTALCQTSGEAEYVNDIPTVSELCAAFVLATEGNATIKNVDPSEALKMLGVQKFISYTDIPKGGVNNFMPTEYDSKNQEEIFCSGQVLYAGQSVGLIIADTQQHADEAALHVKITYTNIQHPVTDIEEAIAKKMFFPKPCEDIVEGNPDEAITSSDKVITGSVKMGTQYHFTMETQSCLCVPKEDIMEVYPTTQWPAAIQSAIGQALGWKSSKIAVKVRRIGGGYGSKISRNMYVSTACAIAAYIMDQPVKLTMSLNTNMKMMGKRFPYLAEYKVGLTNEGKLNGLKVTYYADHGCSASDSTVPGSLIFADNTYYCGNWHLTAVAVRTNTASHTFCRAPSSTPGIFIMETIMENIAHEVSKSPMDVKQLNLYSRGQVAPYGQILSYCNIKDLVQQIKQSAQVEGRMAAIQQFNKQNRWKKKGIGFVPMKFGLTWNGVSFPVIVNIYGHDGSVSIIHGGIEMGQGINTKTMQVCAHELGLPLDIVTVRPTDDGNSANSFFSGSSITSEMCCYGVKLCCQQLMTRIDPVKKKMPGAIWEDIILKCYQEGVDLVARHVVNINDTPKPTPQPFQYNSYGVTVAEVELDVLTGENQINRVDILYDCGESKNPDIDIGQVEGAVVMGIGYWLHEQIKYDPNTGENLTCGTWEYKPPTTLDIPIDFRIQLLRNAPNPIKFIRSKAVGEPPLCMSSAILFALKQAISEARKNSGNDDYFTVGPPTTVEFAQQLCLSNISQYVIK